jgi:sulfur-oxidizing protein SoxZ
MEAPRVKVPETAKVGDVLEIKTLISHEMETGLRKDKSGQLIPRKIINAFSAKFNGQDVFSATLFPSMSANPYIVFYLKVPGSGDLEMTWTEDGGATATAKKTITAA